MMDFQWSGIRLVGCMACWSEMQLVGFLVLRNKVFMPGGWGNKGFPVVRNEVGGVYGMVVRNAVGGISGAQK